MIMIKHYRRPVAGITVGGEKARLTAGVLTKFTNALAAKEVSLYAIGNGENHISFFVDEAEAEKTTLILTDTISKTPFESMSVKRNMGLISITGPELLNTPGLLYKMLAPIEKEKLNILSITSSYDSILMIFDYTDAEKAYKLLNAYIPLKIGVFKKAKERVKEIIKRIIPPKK
jgi:aspartate kinase